jgi:hypothetical protein
MPLKLIRDRDGSIMGESVPLNSHSAGSGAAEPSPALTPARWQLIKELFSLALEREADKRKAFLQQACEDDPELRAEVESLLESAESYGAATSEVFKSVTLPGEGPPSVVEDALIGRRIGDYRIDQRIGIGGMAAVYLVSRADEQFHMQAAIKLLRPDLNQAELLRRFLKERQTLAALDHPNIVKLLDGGSTETGLVDVGETDPHDVHSPNEQPSEPGDGYGDFGQGPHKNSIGDRNDHRTTTHLDFPQSAKCHNIPWRRRKH